jgi:hypothetical protein
LSSATLKGLHLQRLVTTPVGVGMAQKFLSQGSRATRQPWALLRNRFAVEKKV